MTTAILRPRTPIWAESTSLAAACILLLSVMLAPAWGAGTIVDSAGFESPAYHAGNLTGQNTWNHAPVLGLGTATVESAVHFSGAQAVQVNRAAQSNDFWGIVKGGFPTQRFVTVDWDMSVNQTFGATFGPFFGTSAFDYTVGGLVGALGVDATTGEVLYQAADTGVLSAATYDGSTPALVNFGAWNHFRMVLDFTSHQYDIFLGGTQLNLPIGFVDQHNIMGGLQHFTDADITAEFAFDDASSLAATGTAYVDNFLVRDGLLGDYDLNGSVNTADYTVWKQAFGTTVATPGNGADGNGNGKVDAADYTVWRDHLGASLFSGSGSGALSTSAVPEPSTLTLLLCGIVTAAFGCLPRLRRTL